MVHWSIFIALSMRVMLHPINIHHKNCRYSWNHFHSYPYSQGKFRGLSPSIYHIHSLSIDIPKSDCFLSFIWRWYTKSSKTDFHTPQPRHPCTKSHQDKNQSYLPSAYISIGTDSKITSSFNPPCNSSSHIRPSLLLQGPGRCGILHQLLPVTWSVIIVQVGGCIFFWGGGTPY